MYSTFPPPTDESKPEKEIFAWKLLIIIVNMHIWMGFIVLKILFYGIELYKLTKMLSF
jgi:hypothetical protein